MVNRFIRKLNFENKFSGQKLVGFLGRNSFGHKLFRKKRNPLAHKKNLLKKITSIVFLFIFSITYRCSQPSGEKETADQRLMELYLNYPGIKTNKHRSPEFDIRLANLIDQAEKEVYWAMYGFGRKVIIDAVLRAVRRGLDVQLAGNQSTWAHAAGYRDFYNLQRRYPNAKLVSGNSQSIQHNKFVVIDRRYLMTGTGNITNSEIDRNYNAWVIIESKDLSTDFIRDHMQMMAGRYGHAKSRIDYNNVFNVGGVKVEVYFSPHEDAMTRFLRAVSEAEQSIHFAIFAFTHDSLGRLFIEKNKQFYNLNKTDNGTRRLRGIMDRSQLTHNQYVEIYRMAGACGHTYGFQQGAGNNIGGNEFPPIINWNNPNKDNTRCEAPIDFRIDGNENSVHVGDWQAGGGRLHAKTIVIDENTENAKLLLGSFNWSPNANNNNDENLMVIHSPAIVKRFMKFWDGIYKDSVPLDKRYPNNQELANGKSIYQCRSGKKDGQGNCKQNQYQDAVISEVNWAGSMRKIGNRFYAYDANEFIELYNPTNQVIDVSYWTLYFPVIENYTDPGVYKSGWPTAESLRKRGVLGFPGGTYIPPKGFLVVWQTDQRNDINTDGYQFDASKLYDPANAATFNNKITAYNPFNNLSNFFTLYDRRTSNTGRAGSFPNFYYPAFTKGSSASAIDEICRPAYGLNVARFTASNYFNPFEMHVGNSSGFPHRISLWIELRDNRGNLVDIAGINRRNSGAPSNVATSDFNDLGFFAGGFFTSEPAQANNVNRVNLGAMTNKFPLEEAAFNNGSANTNRTLHVNAICNIDPTWGKIYHVSMERKSSLGGGTDSASWEHSVRTGAVGDKGTNIKTNYKERTIATPGSQNSKWSGLP